MTIWSPKNEERKHALAAAASELADVVAAYIEADPEENHDRNDEFDAMEAALQRYREVEKS